MNKKITKKLIWSGGDTRHLIRLMKEHFDLTGEKSVLNPQKRLRIQKELGIPWARIQSKWKYMKSYHQQLVNKHVATKVEPEHEFYKRLSFLNDTVHFLQNFLFFNFFSHLDLFLQFSEICSCRMENFHSKPFEWYCIQQGQLCS